MASHIYDLPYMNINSITFFKMLADETRLAILVLLVRKSELCVCDLTTQLQLSQPKISRHLAALRGAGLLRSRKQGQWVYYRLDEALPSWMLGGLTDASEHYDGCFSLEPVRFDDNQCLN